MVLYSALMWATWNSTLKNYCNSGYTIFMKSDDGCCVNWYFNVRVVTFHQRLKKWKKKTLIAFNPKDFMWKLKLSNVENEKKSRQIFSYGRRFIITSSSRLSEHKMLFRHPNKHISIRLVVFCRFIFCTLLLSLGKLPSTISKRFHVSIAVSRNKKQSGGATYVYICKCFSTVCKAVW